MKRKNKVSNSVADIHSKILDAPRAISLIFMQFSGNFDQKLGWRSLWGRRPLGNPGPTPQIDTSKGV